jgi:alpha-2-macroglobulin
MRSMLANTGSALLVITGLALGWHALVGGDPTPAKPIDADYPTTIPAKNPATLQLQADDRTVHGWISGTASHAGKTVRIALGKETAGAKVGDDNTFSWPYEFKQPVTIEFSLGDLKASLALAPPPAKAQPSAYFVVDRTAYRPGQTLQFAAFLRSEDERGEFAPVTNAEVEVQIVSREKGHIAGRRTLRSDDAGRIAGSYTFTVADTLDEYDVRISDYAGSANVLLAEYRKSKVRLKIAGTPTDGTMKLKFEALDFLDKPVAFTGGSYTAQVVRKTLAPPAALKAEEFVRHERRAIPRLEFDDISEDDLLVHEVESANGLFFSQGGRDIVAELAGDVKPDGEGTIELKPEWTKGGYELVVEGVVTDLNGREQKATETIALAAKVEPAKPALELKLKRTRFQPNEAIEVRAAGSLFEKQTLPGATLLVMKLAYQTPSSAFFGKPQFGEQASGKLPAYGKPETPREEHKLEIVRRTLVTAVPFAADAAKVALAEPGAYLLVAVVPNADGTSTRAERAVLVKRIEDRNPFTIKLDKLEFDRGERLTGTIRSRYADARALLTLRDSRGIRFAKPIQFRNGLHAINEDLPGDLRYGCTLDVAYPEDATTTRIAHAAARIVPTDRLLKVAVTAPDQVAPGSTVKLDLQVDRKEPVDLIVSVYDRSLLAIKPDARPDIRSFYHADERAANRLDRELLRKRLGGVRLNTLIEKAKAIVADPKTPKERRVAMELMLRNYEIEKAFFSSDIVTLLRLAGIDVYFSPRANDNDWQFSFTDYIARKADSNPTLIDVAFATFAYSQERLAFQFFGTTLHVQEYTSMNLGTDYPLQWHPVLGWDDGLGYLNRYRFRPMLSRRGSQFGFAGFGGFGGGGFGGGGFGGGILGGGAANNLGAGGGLAGFGGGNLGNLGGNIGREFLAPLDFAPAIAASPDGGDDLQQLPDLAAGVAIRRNFADTAYWNATLRTDDAGRATVSFKLPDTLTSWQVVVTAVSKKLHVGGATTAIRTFQPIMVWPMLPRTFTEGDAVRVFASVHNRTEKEQSIRVRLKADNGAIRGPAEQTVTVGPKSNAPVHWAFAPKAPGEANLLMTATCDAGADASLKSIPVTRCAAEQIVAYSGFVKDRMTLDLPALEGNGQLEFTFAPSLVADLSDTLGYLVEYPYGCVEQTMSRFLPAIKVSQILKQSGIRDPELEKKLPGVAAAGIKRLIELQNEDGGWSWFGVSNSGSLMTAYAMYGLWQAKLAGFNVDKDVLRKGRERLYRFSSEERGVTERAYCLWVHSIEWKLTDNEWKWIQERATNGTFSHIGLAFALEMAVRGEKPELAKDIADALRKAATVENGLCHWTTAGFERWTDDRFEVTAAALKALVAFDPADPLVEKTLAYFAATKRGNRWNSTKDTAMILFAMCDYLAKTRRIDSKGDSLKLTVNGHEYDVRFDGALVQKLVVPTERLKAGANEVRMKTERTGAMYRAVFRRWKSGRDLEPEAIGLSVRRKFSLVDAKGTIQRELKSGDAVTKGSFVFVEVETVPREVAEFRYLLVESPKPAGCEVIHQDDKRFETLTPKTFDRREDRDAKVCYFLESPEKFETVRSVLLAELAGEFVVAPASAELMYEPLVRGHSGAFVLRVTD